MTPALASIEDLRALLPADCIAEREGKPIFSPQSTEQVATITRHANHHNLSIEILGAGTKRAWGNPIAADILLDTTRLTGVREHSWQDLTATVAAGTPWSAVQDALGLHKQQVALDPLWPDTATVGGIIATNDSGALRLKYGSLRDLIIGMTIVLADGTIAKSGGKVVKNVAGYDLHKLMTGAFGTLGVIAEVTFRLHPIPANTKTWAISSPTAEPIGELMMAILDSQLSTQAMQLHAGTEGYALDVQLATLPEILTLQIEALDQLARSITMETRGLTPTDPFTTHKQLFTPPGGLIIKATMLPSAIAKLSTDVVWLGGSAVTQATGIMFARFREEDAAATLGTLRSYIKSAGDGSLTVLRSPAPLANTEEAPALIREIKHRFDPNRILNPGRFLGGI
jgi:glycolate oxidase FAD binding subunit